MLSWHSLELVSCTKLQTLWAGYGYICAVTARASTDAAAQKLDSLCRLQSAGTTGTTYRLILKLISPPRDGRADEGHLRKMLSYEVEQYFYDQVVPRLSADQVGVAQRLASTRDRQTDELAGLTATLMTDLRPEYPVAGEKRAVLQPVQVTAALEWLARFHGASWAWLPDGDLDKYVLPPLEEASREDRGSKTWLNGGYTYLATRRSEYQSLVDDEDSEWCEALCTPVRGSSVAEMAAELLKPQGRDIESYIHGDVKSENLFTTQDGTRVAFFDFQYVGLGLGVCDLAKLFTCSVPLNMLVGDDDDEDELPEELGMRAGEKRLLEKYRHTLLASDGAKSIKYTWEDFKHHWETALVDWCRFQASWGFWGNTEWLEARVRFIIRDAEWKDWLVRELSS
ncbi:Pfam:DUF227 [Geosmithia morbida]|uniref:Pfam:DUF227 n=1 Tax=Geosmithia morbida TaxID=1094350 RepID=A0A9P4YRQ9_9HYPO|nr:Pfam:DUF227 [Geosmithia morbida]KAF4121896.1 Pfam:DUF227 [Geosmithia morbida]